MQDPQTGRLAYTLTRGQIFACLLQGRLRLILGLGAAFLVLCLAMLLPRFLGGTISPEAFILAILGLFVVQTASEGLAVFVLYRRSGRMPPLPAGPTVLEWDSGGLRLMCGQEYRYVDWNVLNWTEDRQGNIIIRFADARFTRVSRDLMGPEAMAFRRRLAAKKA